VTDQSRPDPDKPRAGKRPTTASESQAGGKEYGQCPDYQRSFEMHNHLSQLTCVRLETQILTLRLQSRQISARNPQSPVSPKPGDSPACRHEQGRRRMACANRVGSDGDAAGTRERKGTAPLDRMESTSLVPSAGAGREAAIASDPRARIWAGGAVSRRQRRRMLSADFGCAVGGTARDGCGRPACRALQDSPRWRRDAHPAMNAGAPTRVDQCAAGAQRQAPRSAASRRSLGASSRRHDDHARSPGKQHFLLAPLGVR
jgi:hypothetical protein